MTGRFRAAGRSSSLLRCLTLLVMATLLQASTVGIEPGLLECLLGRISRLGCSRREGVPFGIMLSSCMSQVMKPGENVTLRMAGPLVNTVQQVVASINSSTNSAGLAPVQWALPDTAASDAFFTRDFWGPRDYHAYLLPASYVGDMMNQERPLAQDLSALAQMPGLDWGGVLPFYREVGAVFGGRVVAQPTHGLSYLLAYRTDLFVPGGLQLPRTWDEVIALAVHFNGTDLNGDGEPDYGICMWQPRDCPSVGVTLGSVLASIVQTRGIRAGLFWEPETMASVVHTDAWEAAMAIVRNLSWYAPAPEIRRAPGLSCQYLDEFRRGRCALALATPEQFKRDSIAGGVPESYVRGKIGTSMLPGSEWVLDWGTGKLVRCTPAVCPFAVPFDDLTQQFEGVGNNKCGGGDSGAGVGGGQAEVGGPGKGCSSVAWVNRVSYTGGAGFSVFINKDKPLDELLSAVYLVQQAVLPERSWELVASPFTGYGPTRTEHLAPANLDRWLAYGYHPDDIAGFIAVTREALSSPNIATDVRCEGARNYTLVMSFTTALLANHSVPLPLVAAQSRALYNRIFNATVTARITSSYRASINYARHSPPQPAASAAGRPKSRAGDQLPSILAGSIVGGVALAVLLGFAVWRWRSRRGVLRQGSRITAPGLGRDTTLCITDIQDSTRLWELLPASTMDSAIDLHHACLRTCSAAHGGYEALTEGDSFTLAFHTPHAALAFCLAAQEALMLQDWPPELLEVDVCRPVWVQPVWRAPTLGAGSMVGVLSSFESRQGRNASQTAAPPALSRIRISREHPTPPPRASMEITAVGTPGTSGPLPPWDEEWRSEGGGSGAAYSHAKGHGAASLGGAASLPAGAASSAPGEIQPWDVSSQAMPPSRIGTQRSVSSNRAATRPAAGASASARYTAGGMGVQMEGAAARAAAAPGPPAHPAQLPPPQSPYHPSQSPYPQSPFSPHHPGLCSGIGQTNSHKSIGSTHHDGPTLPLAPVSSPVAPLAAPTYGPSPSLARSLARLLMAPAPFSSLDVDLPSGPLPPTVHSQPGARSGTQRNSPGGQLMRLAARLLHPDTRHLSGKAPSQAPSDPGDGAGASENGTEPGAARDAPPATWLVGAILSHTYQVCEGVEFTGNSGTLAQSVTMQRAAGQPATAASFTLSHGGQAAFGYQPYPGLASGYGADPDDAVHGTSGSLSSRIRRQYTNRRANEGSRGHFASAGSFRAPGATAQYPQHHQSHQFHHQQQYHQQHHHQQPSALLLFRGMRVRMGMHSGLHAATDMAYHPRMARTRYSGVPMAVAKAVSGAAAGGMVLLSSETHTLLAAGSGTGAPATTQGAAAGRQGATGAHGGGGGKPRDMPYVVWHGGVYGLDDDLPLQEVFLASSPGLLPRLGLLGAPAAGPKATVVTPSVLAAPVGHVAVAAVQVSGAATIAAWDAEVWRESAGLLWRKAASLCLKHGGYLATGLGQLTAAHVQAAARNGLTGRTGSKGNKSGAGALVAAFPSATAAALWVGELLAFGLLAAWPAALLLHELAEEVWLSEAAVRLASAALASPSCEPAAPAAALRPRLGSPAVWTSPAADRNVHATGTGAVAVPPMDHNGEAVIVDVQGLAEVEASGQATLQSGRAVPLGAVLRGGDSADWSRQRSHAGPPSAGNSRAGVVSSSTAALAVGCGTGNHMYSSSGFRGRAGTGTGAGAVTGTGWSDLVAVVEGMEAPESAVRSAHSRSTGGARQHHAGGARADPHKPRSRSSTLWLVPPEAAAAQLAGANTRSAQLASAARTGRAQLLSPSVLPASVILPPADPCGLQMNAGGNGPGGSFEQQQVPVQLRRAASLKGLNTAAAVRPRYAGPPGARKLQGEAQSAPWRALAAKALSPLAPTLTEGGEDRLSDDGEASVGDESPRSSSGGEAGEGRPAGRRGLGYKARSTPGLIRLHPEALKPTPLLGDTDQEPGASSDGFAPAAPVDASGVCLPPVGECAAVEQQQQEQQEQSDGTEHRDITNPEVGGHAAPSGGPAVTATATSPFAFPAAQYNQQSQQEHQQEGEQHGGDAPALCVDPTHADAGAAQLFLAATPSLHGADHGVTPDQPTDVLGSTAEPCAVGLLLASGPNWRREFGTRHSSLELSGGAASGLLDTVGTQADTCLPPDTLPRVVCRGLRLRGGLDVGHVALQVNGVTGTVSYKGPAATSVWTMAAAAPVSNAYISRAAWAACKEDELQAKLHPAAVAKLHVFGS